MMAPFCFVIVASGDILFHWDIHFLQKLIIPNSDQVESNFWSRMGIVFMIGQHMACRQPCVPVKTETLILKQHPCMIKNCWKSLEVSIKVNEFTPSAAHCRNNCPFFQVLFILFYQLIKSWGWSMPTIVQSFHLDWILFSCVSAM